MPAMEALLMKLPLLLLVAAQAAATRLTSTNLFVSPTGKPNAAGTADDPFQSLADAQAAVRGILRTADAQQDITVNVQPGSYFNTSLTFEREDGGSVTWRSSGGPGAAILYGGLRVQGWVKAKAHAGGAVWKAKLPSELVDSQGRALFHMLVQDNRSAWLARAPNHGSGYLPCGGGDTGFTCVAGVLPDHFDCVNSTCSVFTRAGYSSDIRAVTAVDLEAHKVSINSSNTDQSRGSFYLQGALELLDAEGEWAVRHGWLFFWPYSVQGVAVSPNELVVTAPKRQRVLSFVGADRREPVMGMTLSHLQIVGASMPATYTYACKGTGASASPFGADCAADGGPDSPDETNTSPLASSQGMIYLENATGITITGCSLRAGGIAGIWMQEANENHTISGCLVADFAGFGLYSNGVGVGDARYSSPQAADVNHGHVITNNVFYNGGRQILYGSGVWLFQTGSTTITHNRISRFPRDGVGFYGMLPFWTADVGGPVAPGMPPSNRSAASRTPWGKFVTWNPTPGRDGSGSNGSSSSSSTYTTWDLLFNKHNYLGYNDISNCNRQGLDGGVVESWGSSKNNTWEANAIHDNEGYGGLSLLFADDFTPDLAVRNNVVYANRCPILNGTNCAVFMIKSVRLNVSNNVVADSNYSHVFEVANYRMPAALLSVERNIVWNVSQRRDTARAGGAYTSTCESLSWGNHTWDNATLYDLLAAGDGTNAQRSRLKQYGFNATQLAWPVISRVDSNFADDLAWLRRAKCSSWDVNSLELTSRPFTSVASPPSPWHSRTALDYAIAPTSELVTKHGFDRVDVREIGLLQRSDFAFDLSNWKRRDAFGAVQAEDYDRASNLWTTQARGVGSGTADHFQKETAYAVPSGSWARYDGIDFGPAGGSSVIRAAAFATAVADGATLRFQLGGPQSSDQLLSEVVVPPKSKGYSVFNGTLLSSGVHVPAGIHAVFMVMTGSGSVGAVVDSFWFERRRR